MRTTSDEFSNLHALVVENDAGGMAIIGVVLRHLGIQALIDTDGRDVVGMAHAMKPQPDLIFLDLHMPHISGVEMLRQIRADQALHDTIVIAISSQDADDVIPECQAAGFNGFISKPISRSRLPRQLRRLLRGEAVWESYY